MADNNCIKCDVAIVGSGFAGALIANELSPKGISVVILEAGPGVQPNINDYMKRFYKAAVKVPESAYPPELFADPGKLAARQADLGNARPQELAGSQTELSDSEGAATLRQHLRSRRRRHVALARNVPEICAARFHHENELRQERGELPLSGLAKRHHLPKTEPILFQGGG